MTDSGYQILQLVLFLMLWWLFAHEYRQYRTDLLRQRLFNIRDNLFKEASEGVIGFDDEAYKLTRTTLNGMIRFAHEMSLTRLLIMTITQRYILKDEGILDYRRALKRALEGLSNDAKKSVLKVHGGMHICVALHVIHTSIIFAPLCIPIIWVLRALKRTQEVKNKIRKSKIYRHFLAPRLDAEANGIGQSPRTA